MLTRRPENDILGFRVAGVAQNLDFDNRGQASQRRRKGDTLKGKREAH
jgi:hypothetical protein